MIISWLHLETPDYPGFSAFHRRNIYKTPDLSHTNKKNTIKKNQNSTKIIKIKNLQTQKKKKTPQSKRIRVQNPTNPKTKIFQKKKKSTSTISKDHVREHIHGGDIAGGASEAAAIAVTGEGDQNWMKRLRPQRSLDSRAAEEIGVMNNR